MTATRAPAACGTRTAAWRHRDRGETMDDACRAALRKYHSDRRAEGKAARSAARLRRASQTAARLQREIRTVRLPGGTPYALGVFAGTRIMHPHVPDGGNSTMCQLCFGWCNDVRHTSTVWAVS